MSKSVSYIGRCFPFAAANCRAFREESVRCEIFKGRTMFNFKPYVPGFNVEPPADAEVPGFRMNADGSVRTGGAAVGPATFLHSSRLDADRGCLWQRRNRLVEFVWPVLLA